MREPDNLSGGFGGFVRVPFFREVAIVAAVIRRFSRMLAHGVNLTEELAAYRRHA